MPSKASLEFLVPPHPSLPFGKGLRHLRRVLEVPSPKSYPRLPQWRRSASAILWQTADSKGLRCRVIWCHYVQTSQRQAKQDPFGDPFWPWSIWPAYAHTMGCHEAWPSASTCHMMSVLSVVSKLHRVSYTYGRSFVIKEIAKFNQDSSSFLQTARWCTSQGWPWFSKSLVLSPLMRRSINLVSNENTTWLRIARHDWLLWHRSHLPYLKSFRPWEFVTHSTQSSHRERSRGFGKGGKAGKREGKQPRPQGPGPGTGKGWHC